MRKLICLAFVVGVCVCHFAWAGAAAPWGFGPLAQTEARPRGTVMLVGVYHAPGQFWSEKFSPAHIRSALEAFKPQVVGVESNPEWFARGLFYLTTYEAQNVAVSWARRHKVPVYGIDWIGGLQDKDYAETQRVAQVRRVRDDAASPRVSPSAFQYGLASFADTPAPQEDAELDFDALNGPAVGEKWVKWIDEGKHAKGSPQEYMEERDNHIVNYITAAADRHAGARMAVVIGMAHRGDLERKLRARGFTVVGPAGVGGASDSNARGMDERLTAEDIAAILSEAWDSTARPGVARERAERLLFRLQKLTGDDPRAGAWGEYFNARRRMLGGDLGGARAAFEKIAAGAGETRFPFRGNRWRHYLTLPQAALLELGRIADVQGRRQEAVVHYNRLLGSLKLPAYSEDYHSDYLFLATARNAVRALTLSPYTKAAAADADAARDDASAAPPDGESKAGRGLQRSLELSRSGQFEAAAAAVEEVLRGSDATHMERCEGYILAAGAYTYAKKEAAARPHLTKFDAQCGDLPRGHWVYRERKKLGAGRAPN